MILLTGHAALETSIEGMKLGAFDYLLKPVKLEDLLPKIGAAAQKKGNHEEKIHQARRQAAPHIPGKAPAPPQDDKSIS